MPPAAPSLRPGPARADLLRLGRAGQPWSFLAAAAPTLERTPDDAELRALAARQLARLGLRTLAAEQLALAARLGLDTVEHRSVAATIDALPARPDAFPFEARLAHARANAAALAAAGDRLHAPAGWSPRVACEAWAAAGPDEVFVATDGNVVRRAAGDVEPARWSMGDARAAARAACASPTSAGSRHAPRTVVGLSTPWTLAEALRDPAAEELPGFTRAVRIIEDDAAALFAGLSLGDLRPAIADPRTRWFVGHGAAERFAAWLSSADTSSSMVAGALRAGPVLAAGPEDLVRPVLAAVHAAAASDAAELSRLRVRVRERLATRDRAWWARRYADALAPGAPAPLRVLVPTCRYTTYVQHSARALASALISRGIRAEILIEPDAHHTLSATAYWRAIDRLDPDLVISINYPRQTRAEAFPEGIPFVCWVQDNMPHLFDHALGAAQSELDFVVGHAAERLVGFWSYPADRARQAPVCVGEDVFHDGPVSPALRERFACEIAFVSNHAETPEDLHERLAAQAGPARAVLDRVRDAAIERLEEERRGEVSHFPLSIRLMLDTEDAMRRVLGRVDRAEARRLVEQHAMPLLERIVRHESIGWAADICARRGWRLRLFGRGWESHPRFAPFAAGPVAHGDELRACYSAAAVHLHASAVNLVHQRVAECALSGGLPAVRVLGSNLRHPAALASALRLWEREPEFRRPNDELRRVSPDLPCDELGFVVADDPALMADTALRQRLGLPVRPTLLVAQSVLDAQRSTGRVRGAGLCAETFFGDLSTLGFTTPAGLESLVERALAQGPWLATARASLQRRVRASMTMDGLATATIDLVRDTLAANAPVEAAAPAR